MLTGMTLLALKSIVDNKWIVAVAAPLALHPIPMEEGGDDYIAVVLNPKLCHNKMCTLT